MKILLIEDDKALSEAILTFLLREGYVCETASNFRQAEEKVMIYQYDCILVDITLPDGNGFDIIRELKKQHMLSGIIIISAKNSLDDKVTGLDIGADDYLVKPFHLSELNARIKSLVRRQQYQGNNEIVFRNIVVQIDSKTVLVGGHRLDLTPKEYQLLLYFLSNTSRVVSKNALAEHLWGDYMDTADSYDFIYSQVKNLRKKLNRDGQESYLHAVYGMGYKFIKN